MFTFEAPRKLSEVSRHQQCVLLKAAFELVFANI